MYLEFISMKNISAIEKLTIKPSFTDERNPKPLIIVGENGSGKTVLLSSIMDSFYEIGSELFINIGKQGHITRKFYKTNGIQNLKIDSESGFVAIQYKSLLSKTIEYLDCIECDTKRLKGEIKKIQSDWTLSPKLATSKQIHISDKKKLQEEWQEQAHYYQPAYRYEEPFWKIPDFYHSFGDKVEFINKYYKEIEVLTSFKENLSFILDVFLDIGAKYKEQTKKTQLLMNKNEQLLKKINDILKEIKAEDVSIVLMHRKFGGGGRVGIMKNDKPYLNNINKLSLGESVLLNMFVNILRHTDLSMEPLNELEGIVVIDEIDVHLHSNLQSDVLPSLIKLFPKIQFIITTHSPLFVLGMQKVFGDNGFDLIEMPQGEKISAERFKEFQKAYDVLKETKAFENDIEKKILAMQKPKVFVEGKTDVQYIKKALELLKQDLIEKIDIEQIGSEDEKGSDFSGDDALKKTGKFLKYHQDSINHKVLILHDPETKNVNIGWINNKVKIAQMPFTENRKIESGIENLFPNDLLGKCYENQDKSKKILDKICINDKLEKFQINDKQKVKVCDWICKNGTKKDFNDFQNIIKIFDDFLNDK